MRCLLFSVALILASVLLHANLVDGQSSSVMQRKEKRLADCTLESKSIDDCDPVNYAIRVGVFAAPGIIIAVFMILACPLYCGAKYCCNCCGGRNQSPNFCCPNKELPARYSVGDILRPKILSLVAFIFVIAGMTWGMVGTSTLVSGLKNFGTTAINIPNLMTDLITEIDNALVVQRYLSSNDSFVEERLLTSGTLGNNVKSDAEKVKNDLKKAVESVIDRFQRYIDDYNIYLYVIFAIPAVLVLIGLIAAVCSCRKVLPMALVWWLFLLGFLIWISHTVFAGLSMVLNDFCAEVHGLKNQQLNIVAPLIQCSDSMFSDFKTNFKSLEAQQSESACSSIADTCFIEGNSLQSNLNSGRFYRCPSPMTCAGTNFAQLVTWMQYDIYIHPNVTTNVQSINTGQGCATASNRQKCSIALCSSDCTTGTPPVLSDTGKKSKELFYSFAVAKNVSNVIDTLGARFSTCDTVLSIIIGPFDPSCTQLVDGTIAGRQATGLLGLSLIAAIFVFAWGAKRFLPISEANVAQREGMNNPDKDE